MRTNMINKTKIGRAVLAGGLTAVAVLTSGAASAEPTPGGAGLLARGADAETRAIAEAEPQTVSAMANLCGSGYGLFDAEQLPDERRFGTLFMYNKYRDSGGLSGVCAIFDNNLGTTKYMSLKVCDNIAAPNKTCDTDAGNFSQYAGPVRITGSHAALFCSKATAIMKSSGVNIIDAVRGATPCN